MINQNKFIRFRNSAGETQFINVDSIECIYIRSNCDETAFMIGINSKTGHDYIIEPYTDFESASKFEDGVVKILNNVATLQKGE